MDTVKVKVTVNGEVVEHTRESLAEFLDGVRLFCTDSLPTKMGTLSCPYTHSFLMISDTPGKAGYLDVTTATPCMEHRAVNTVLPAGLRPQFYKYGVERTTSESKHDAVLELAFDYGLENADAG